MKILVIGSGGREHALCWRLKESASAPQVFCTPGNAGIEQVATCVALETHQAIVDFCIEEKIVLVVVGPEKPLVDGLVDKLEARDIAVIGPSQKAAQLEGSKDFTKRLCRKYGIPTASSMTFDEPQGAIAYVQTQGAPIVIKADGLAAGKGVTVAMNTAQAVEAVELCFSGKFGDAGQRVLIEEYLEGQEVSFFALCDGDKAVELGSAQDHKRVGEGDTGPNTGGMGAYSPAPIMTESLRKQVMDEIILPTVNGMKADGMAYKGFLFAGLMMTEDGPKLIEFNCRFGDPEAQVILPRIEGDFALDLVQVAERGLRDKTFTLADQSALCVVMASNGYPDEYEKGSIIKGAEQTLENGVVFHAGTRRGRSCGKLKANGGRVLGVTAWADSLQAAQTQAYKMVDHIDWPEGFCRRDIGWRALTPHKESA